MGRKKDTTAAIGRSIIKDRQKKPKPGQTWLHTSELNDGYDWNRINLNSVTEQNSLDEFLSTAKLAGTEFTAEKLNITVINSQQYTGLPTIEESQANQQAQEDNKELLCIPRRPKWDSSTTASELELLERDSFLSWRRQLASLQEKEHVVLTPFERNLEFWRQLWRVLERSDVVVQIVDARNPLLFRCEDLEKYVLEVSPEKVNIILLSKADLLSEEQRDIWADYFTDQGIKVVFWSAFSETERLKEEQREQDENEDISEEMEDEEDEEDEEEDLSLERRQETDILPADNSDSSSSLEQYLGNLQLTCEKDEKLKKINEICTSKQLDVITSSDSLKIEKSNTSEVTAEITSHSDTHITSELNTDNNTVHDITESIKTIEVKGDKSDEISTLSSSSTDSIGDEGTSESKNTLVNSGKLVTGEELLVILRSVHEGRHKVTDGVTTIGMVGYPNVGKSSTINAILQQKKVPVSATPGRTKHFQTLFVEPTMCLCDCPGLVMPSFVSSKAEMVINGILPVDQLRDFLSPVSTVCQIVPRETLERFYKIQIIKPQEGEDKNRPPLALEFLNAYAYNRGYMTQKGVPHSRFAALLVLKDFVKGKLLYRKPPPGISDVEFGAVQEPIVKEGYELSKPNRATITAEGTQQKNATSESVDAAFFNERNPTSHSKGRIGSRGLSWVDGRVVYKDESLKESVESKPWRKHGNRNKKEKLRKKYSYLDVK